MVEHTSPSNSSANWIVDFCGDGVGKALSLPFFFSLLRPPLTIGVVAIAGDIKEAALAAFPVASSATALLPCPRFSLGVVAVGGDPDKAALAVFLLATFVTACSTMSSGGDFRS